MEAHKKKSLRELILEAEDIEVRLVEVPAWDVTVELRTPTVEARGELIAQFISEGTGKIDYGRMYPALIIATAYVPGTDQRIFNVDDVKALQGKSAKVMEMLGGIAVELSGLEKTEERIEAGKDDSTPILNSLTSSA